MKSERVYTVVEIARRLPCNMKHESGCKVRLMLRPVQDGGQVLTWELDESDAADLELGDRVVLSLITA